jgi:hypothetical protein
MRNRKEPSCMPGQQSANLLHRNVQHPHLTLTGTEGPLIASFAINGLAPHNVQGIKQGSAKLTGTRFVLVTTACCNLSSHADPDDHGWRYVHPRMCSLWGDRCGRCV